MKTHAEVQLERLRLERAIVRQQALRAYADPAELPYLIFAALTGRQSFADPDEIGDALAEVVAKQEAA